MHQQDAMGRAIARTGAGTSRRALRASRLCLNTHRWLHALAGSASLHVLRAPRASVAGRMDSRLTVRVLLAQARAVSVHAWLAGVASARDFVARLERVAGRGVAARGMQALRWWVRGTSGEAALARGAPGDAGASGRVVREALRSLRVDTPGRVLLQLWRAPGHVTPRERAVSVRDLRVREVSRVLRTLASSRLIAHTQPLIREWVSRYLSAADGAGVAAARAADAAQNPSVVSTTLVMTGLRTRLASLKLADLSATKAAHPSVASIAVAPRGRTQRSHEPVSRRRLRLRARHDEARRRGAAHRMPVTPRGAAGFAIRTPSAFPSVAPGIRSAGHRSDAIADSAMATAIMRLHTPSPAVVATPAAQTFTAMPRGYTAPEATLAFRRTPRASAPDSPRQTQQLQQQVARQVTQELTQNTPWRGQLEQAVLAPRVLRELSERVAGAIAGRQGLERYRRGL
jgi:hypothetical protein